MFIVFLLVAPLTSLAGCAMATGVHIANDFVKHIVREVSPYWMLVILPPGLAFIVWFCERYLPGIEGSGIPKTIAAYRKVGCAHEAPTSLWDDMWNGGFSKTFLSLKLAISKLTVTILLALIGASVGPEGPMVLIGASIASAFAKYATLPFFFQKAAIASGAAAALTTAFNSPAGGLAFAIEEVAGEFEYFNFRLPIIACVALTGLVTNNIPGFGNVFLGERLEPYHPGDWLAVPVLGIVLGIMGGCFARCMAEGAKFRKRHPELARKYSVAFAGVMGLVVVMLGLWTNGIVFGPGDEYSNYLLNAVKGGTIPDEPIMWLYGPLKFLSTLATAITNVSGGLFVPGYSVGIGLSVYLARVCSWVAPETVLVYGMIAYFSGFTQGPFNATLIGMEITAMSVHKAPGALMCAVIAALASKLVCPYPFYTYMGRIGNQPVPAPEVRHRQV